MIKISSLRRLPPKAVMSSFLANLVGAKPCGWYSATILPSCPARVVNVADIFSGLWAKSSITVMFLLLVPIIWKRRSVPAKSLRYSAAFRGGMSSKLAVAIARITSYNVCYTKLLRVMIN